jgi:branched-chain amino acid transport system substrate-binding protein
VRTALLRCGAAAAILATLMGAAACGGEGSRRTRLELTIGVLLPLTGPRQQLGDAGRRSVDVAVQEIRDAVRAQRSDHELTLKEADEGADPGATLRAAQKLSRQGVDCVVGAWASADTLSAASGTLVKDDVLTISPASSDDSISRMTDTGLLNRTVLPDSRQGPALADLMARELGGAKGKVASVGAFRSNYGGALVKSFTGAWEARGGKVGEVVLYKPDQQTYRPEAGRLVKGRPDAFVFFDLPETFTKLVPELQATRKWSPAKTFAGDGLATKDMAANLTLKGIRGVAPGAPDKGAAAKAFDRLYRDAPATKRQSFDAQTFDATILCYLAAVAAGSTNGGDMADKLRAVSSPPGKKYTWEQLPQALKALEDDKEIDYDGASGPVDLDRNGDPMSGTYDAYRFADGKIDVYGDVTVSVQPTTAPTPSGAAKQGANQGATGK